MTYSIEKNAGSLVVKYDGRVCDEMYCPIELHCSDNCFENPCTPDYLDFKRGKDICAQIDLKLLLEVDGVDVSEMSREEKKDAIKACVDALCAAPTPEEIAAGVSVIWACKKGEGSEKVPIEVCKNQAGDIEYNDGTTVMDLATFNENYDCDCEETCECTTFVYTAEEGEVIDNNFLLEEANNSPEVISILGGEAIGISEIQFATDGNQKADGNFYWNGSKAQDLDLGDGFHFGEEDKFEDIPNFRIEVTKGQVRFSYSVYLCE